MKRMLLAILALFSGFGNASAAIGGHGCGGACPACLPPPAPRTSPEKKQDKKDGQ